MKLRTKKIIARELLTIIIILALAGLFGLCIYPYNAYKQSRIHSIEGIINSQKKISDSLSAQYNSKLSEQNNFSNLLSAEYNDSSSDQNVSTGLWKVLDKAYHSDFIPFLYNSKLFNPIFLKFIKSNGYEDSKAFENFIGKNLLTKNDSINFNESKNIYQSTSELENKKRHYQSQIIKSEKQIKLSVLVLVIFLTITYPLRFLIFGIKWSIKTIKQKE